MLVLVLLFVAPSDAPSDALSDALVLVSTIIQSDLHIIATCRGETRISCDSAIVIDQLAQANNAVSRMAR